MKLQQITPDNPPGGISYCMTKYLRGNGEDMHYVGYPSSKGNGGKIDAERLKKFKFAKIEKKYKILGVKSKLINKIYKRKCTFN